MIKNEQELLEHLEVDSRKGAERSVYKYTSCGAWISFQDAGGEVGTGAHEWWFARLRLSICGVLVVSLRKAHQRTQPLTRDIPKSVADYLCIDLDHASQHGRSVLRIGDVSASQFFRDLEGRSLRDGSKVVKFTVERKREFRGGITVGSIVEGVEQCATPVELEYPFSEEDYDKAIESVEKEVNEIWDETHGCDECGPESPETGCRAVRSDCPGCGGDGVSM